MTVREYADRYGLSVSYAYKQAKSGRIPARKIGDLWDMGDVPLCP